MNKEEKLYNDLFGHISDETTNRIEYLFGNKIDNEQYMLDIIKSAKIIDKIKYRKINFTMWKIVKPSARPRVNTRMGFVRMYVPGAKENGDWFEKFAKEEKLPYIETPCIINLKNYEKTPSSFSKKNKILAELGSLRPWKRTGDIDNYCKSILDAIQHGMLKDDCLVIDSRQQLFYSIKPHAEIEILYMEKFPKY